MTTTKHTPGPWFVDHLVSSSGENPKEQLAVVTRHVTVAEFPHAQGASTETMEANAALIAAAPAMLEALKGVRRDILNNDRLGHPTSRDFGDAMCVCSACAWIRTVDALTDQAEGRS